MKTQLLVSALAIATVLGAEAASLRRLPQVTVAEGESAQLDGQNAVGIRVANSAIASVTPPDGNRSTLSGIRLGVTELTYADDRAPFAVQEVRIVPTYWPMLQKFFEDDPEISIGVIGDKVVVGGQTANVDTLRRLDEVKRMDTQRLVVQVDYSAASLGALVSDFLESSNVSNVDVRVIGRDVCLAGRMYDNQTIEKTQKRVGEFLKDFKGVTVNADGLKVYKQKILIDIDLVAFDKVKARNLGIQTPSDITAVGSFNYGWDWERGVTGDNSDERTVTGTGNSTLTGTEAGSTSTTENKLDSTLTRTFTDALSKDNKQTIKSSVGISDVQVKLNLLKQNGATKSVYRTQLSTQSGEEVEFQNGGTIHRSVTGSFAATIQTIEYGFIIKALPTIIDRDTINLQFELNNKPPVTVTDGDITLTSYMTKSKYVLKPGEMIVLSGFDMKSESEQKDGIPFLSRIPLIGRFFGNKNSNEEKQEMILVVSVNWALEDDSENSRTRLKKAQEQSVEMEMP